MSGTRMIGLDLSDKSQWQVFSLGNWCNCSAEDAADYADEGSMRIRLI